MAACDVKFEPVELPRRRSAARVSVRDAHYTSSSCSARQILRPRAVGVSGFCRYFEQAGERVVLAGAFSRPRIDWTLPLLAR